MPRRYVLLSLIFAVAAQPIVRPDSPTLRIGAKGTFEKEGYIVVEIEANSPVTKMINEKGAVGSLEPNDVILSIDGAKPSSYDALVTSLNKSVSGELNVEVQDHRTNAVQTWTICAIPTEDGRFAIARDTYLREIRAAGGEGQEEKQIVELSRNLVTNSLDVYLPIVNFDFSPPDQSPIKLVGQVTRAIALLKDCVIDVPQPIWVDQRLLSEVDALIEPRYAIFLDPHISDSERLDVVQDLYASVQKKLNASFEAWLKEKGYERGGVAGAPAEIAFIAKAGEAGAFIELMSRADMILTLLQNKEQLNPLSVNGKAILDGAIHWRRLPREGYSTAYGNYFYRLVIPQANGALHPQAFDPNRKFTLRDQPPTEEILFP